MTLMTLQERLGSETVVDRGQSLTDCLLIHILLNVRTLQLDLEESLDLFVPSSLCGHKEQIVFSVFHY